MAISIQPYTAAWESAVRGFNARLDAAGVMPEIRLGVPDARPARVTRRIHHEQFVAVDGDRVVGGYGLKHQEFAFRNGIQTIAHYALPLSEGIINRSYAPLGVQLLRHALKRQPLLFGLGMGGTDRPLPRLMNTMGWKLCLVPLYFKVNHPARFLRRSSPLRTTPIRKFLLDLAAVTGFGWLGIKSLQWWQRRKTQGVTPTTEIVSRFEGWADDVWHRCAGRYAMIAVRDTEVLNLLYPQESPRFLRLRIRRGGATLGWAVVLDSHMPDDHKYFAGLRVGSIVDTLAMPEHAGGVISAATDFLEERGVDLIVSNQSQAAWCQALQAAGFLAGPSNFAFAPSNALAALIQPHEEMIRSVHLNRGDGDGPIHL